MKDKVKVTTEVKKDIPKIIAKKPALISYSKADFISTVAVLCANDEDLKVPVACEVAESICQIAGDHYNKMVIAEQDRELKKAVEAESKLRYVRVEYMDGDIRYWTTNLSKGLVSDGKLQSFVVNAAQAERPFMHTRKYELMDTRLMGEGAKVTYVIERKELI